MTADTSLPSSALPRHLLPDNYHVSQGRLSIGGCDLIELAEAHGTPLFVYDEEHLRSRCREAVKAFGSDVSYAAKAFLCVAMAQLVHSEGLSMDVATGGELHVALAAGVPADRLVLHGNNKSMASCARRSEPEWDELWWTASMNSTVWMPFMPRPARGPGCCCASRPVWRPTPTPIW